MKHGQSIPHPCPSVFIRGWIAARVSIPPRPSFPNSAWERTCPRSSASSVLPPRPHRRSGTSPTRHSRVKLRSEGEIRLAREMQNPENTHCWLSLQILSSRAQRRTSSYFSLQTKSMGDVWKWSEIFRFAQHNMACCARTHPETTLMSRTPPPPPSDPLAAPWAEARARESRRSFDAEAAERARKIPGWVGVSPAGAGILPATNSGGMRGARVEEPGKMPASAGGTPTLPGASPTT